MSPARNAALVALASWLLLAAATSRSPQGLHFYDPVVQLKALQQFQRGDSPAGHVWQRVDPTDLSRDLAEPVGWWPPSIPLLTHPLTSGLGLNFGSALRTLVIVAGGLGVVGWALWLARFALPLPWLFTLCALLPWVRHASAAHFRFSGEILAFAVAPWIFLGCARGLERIRDGHTGIGVPALIGLGLGLAYWVKYSAFVTVAAALLATGLLATRWLRSWRPALLPLLALALAAAAGPLALKLLHAAQGALDPVGRANPANLGPALALFFIGNPALGLADAAGPYFDALVHPGVAGLGGHHHSIVAWIGFPGGLLLAWLLLRVLRDPAAPPAAALAALALPIFAVLMLGMWLTSDVARDTRFFIPAAFAALPVVLVAARAAWLGAAFPLRALLLAGAAVYLVVPLLYGPLFVTLKVAHTHALRPGPTGLALPSLGASDHAALLASLRPYQASNVVWIVDNLEAALELPGRSLTPISGRSIAEDMRQIYQPPARLDHWRTSRTVELRALSSQRTAPPPLLATVPGVTAWTALPTASPSVVVWAATLPPTAQPPTSRP